MYILCETFYIIEFIIYNVHVKCFIPTKYLSLYASVIFFDCQVLVSHQISCKQNKKVIPTYPVSNNFKIGTLKLMDLYAPFNTLYLYKTM